MVHNVHYDMALQVRTCSYLKSPAEGAACQHHSLWFSASWVFESDRWVFSAFGWSSYLTFWVKKPTVVDGVICWNQQKKLNMNSMRQVTCYIWTDEIIFMFWRWKKLPNSTIAVKPVEGSFSATSRRWQLETGLLEKPIYDIKFQ